jgi:hypothetical protein
VSPLPCTIHPQTQALAIFHLPQPIPQDIQVHRLLLLHRHRPHCRSLPPSYSLPPQQPASRCADAVERAVAAAASTCAGSPSDNPLHPVTSDAPAPHHTAAADNHVDNADSDDAMRISPPPPAPASLLSPHPNFLSHFQTANPFESPQIMQTPSTHDAICCFGNQQQQQQQQQQQPNYLIQASCSWRSRMRTLQGRPWLVLAQR